MSKGCRKGLTYSRSMVYVFLLSVHQEQLQRSKCRVSWGEASVLRSLLSNPQLIRVDPSINLFMYRYLRKFRARRVGKNLVIHSHLPPLNSKAFTRFVDEHLLARIAGPSHAQIGLTGSCPQNCVYCYNKNRSGQVMDRDTIIKTIRDLKRMGVFWLGLTGGEPLLSKDIIEITESAADGCAVKLFTTGSFLTRQLAADLQKAGLFSVAVSLDHWRAEEHDQARRHAGAFKTALAAIDILKNLDGMHVSVSTVLSREMIRKDQVDEMLQFLIGLGVHEAWIGETKPSLPAFWDKDLVITEDERLKLVRLQDRYNREGKITVNYLGHFEGREHFGCSAGRKMIYVDAFGEVSPCVFTPVTFGNVQNRPVQDIYREMRERFPTEGPCFINRNFGLLRKYHRGVTPIGVEDTLNMMQEVRFGPKSGFFQLYYRKGEHGND